VPPGAWQEFAVIAGEASAALTGLLFVAVSRSIDRTVGRRNLRSSIPQKQLQGRV
jgi:hypothetical protein